MSPFFQSLQQVRAEGARSWVHCAYFNGNRIDKGTAAEFDNFHDKLEAALFMPVSEGVMARSMLIPSIRKYISKKSVRGCGFVDGNETESNRRKRCVEKSRNTVLC
jgi:hypothetical protein